MSIHSHSQDGKKFDTRRWNDGKHIKPIDGSKYENLIERAVNLYQEELEKRNEDRE